MNWYHVTVTGYSGNEEIGIGESKAYVQAENKKELKDICESYKRAFGFGTIKNVNIEKEFSTELYNNPEEDIKSKMADTESSGVFMLYRNGVKIPKEVI